MRATHPAHRDDMTAHTGCAMAAQPASPLALRLTGLRARPSVLAAPPAVATVLPGRGRAPPAQDGAREAGCATCWGGSAGSASLLRCARCPT